METTQVYGSRSDSVVDLEMWWPAQEGHVPDANRARYVISRTSPTSGGTRAEVRVEGRKEPIGRVVDGDRGGFRAVYESHFPGGLPETSRPHTGEETASFRDAVTMILSRWYASGEVERQARGRAEDEARMRQVDEFFRRPDAA